MAVEWLQQLEEETKRVLAEKGWSLRRAQNFTGIHYSSIQNMSQGRRVGAEHLIRFARAIGEEPSYWLKLAGYDYVGGILEQRGISYPTSSPGNNADLIRERIEDGYAPDEHELVRLYRGAPSGVKGSVAEILRAVQREADEGEEVLGPDE